jgi:hypothetical protein
VIEQIIEKLSKFGFGGVMLMFFGQPTDGKAFVTLLPEKSVFAMMWWEPGMRHPQGLTRFGPFSYEEFKSQLKEEELAWLEKELDKKKEAMAAQQV